MCIWPTTSTRWGLPLHARFAMCSTWLRSWAPPRSTPNYRSGNRVGHRTRTQPGHIHPRDPPFGHRRNCRDRAPRPPARPRTGAAREALTRSGYSRCASRRPFSIRADADAAGGNRFVPARFVLDAGVSDPRSRVVHVRSVLGEWKHDPALGMTDALSGLLNRLPPAPTTLAFGSMLKGRDFVATSMPGPPFESYVAGARVIGLHAFAPTLGRSPRVRVPNPRKHRTSAGRAPPRGCHVQT